MITEHKISVFKTARVFQAGESVDEKWLVLHGYGQLAGFFIKHFEDLNFKDKSFYAAEGLSRFYLNGFSGRVGATWMTSEDRLTDIADIESYLNELFNTLIKTDVPKFNLLGFSQGATTAVRWFMKRKPTLKKMILWSGSLPSELNVEEFVEALKNTQLFIVYGNKDPLLTHEFLQKANEIQKLIPGSHLLEFDGGHELDKKILKRIIS